MSHSNIAGKIVVLGPSGSGKGTQAKMIARKYRWQHVSMGQLFRDEIEAKTKLGKQAKEFIEKGLWASLELTMTILEPELKQVINSGFVLDGFPRSFDQIKALRDLLVKFGTDIDIVFHLDIRPAVIMARRKAHWAKGKSFYKEGQRSDETEESIKNRFAEYKKNLGPILAFYQDQGILRRINGERPIGPIFRDIVTIIDNRFFKKDD
ncbi:MAG: nucleoside monophosphate kinase [Patescibacteria group bacterium]|nr:nucleoside monophosphate kinase [Patescibacteria group bacterium]